MNPLPMRYECHVYSRGQASDSPSLPVHSTTPTRTRCGPLLDRFSVLGHYVCAFRGRRDNYQVPLALAETGRLDRFITDAYVPASCLRLVVATPLPARWSETLALRSDPGIPTRRVRCLWATTALEHSRHRLGFSRIDTFAKLDQHFSRAAAARARRARTNLLLYTPYAWEAFAEFTYPRHIPRKVLFQHHPHTDFENRLLAEDFKRFPEIGLSYAEATGRRLPASLQARTADCWRLADLILCASAFTRRSLLEAGADSKRCVVVPYGFEMEPLPLEMLNGEQTTNEVSRFRALFVGSGVQRKGLHHLLYAWRRARLPADSELTLICRNIDPGLEELVACSRATRLFRGVSRPELAKLYRGHSLFVMPSLSEGFGQVFLEALGFGCPVLGTANTCLPDLGTEEDGIFLSGVADLDHLVYQLERLASCLPTRPGLRGCAQCCARKFTWLRFREAVTSYL
jgi:glycosyltransferase involved in cell wall biosynthesis